jgi:hypothetical protein
MPTHYLGVNRVGGGTTIRGADFVEGLPALPVNAGGSLAGNDSMAASSISSCVCSLVFSIGLADGASVEQAF